MQMGDTSASYIHLVENIAPYSFDIFTNLCYLIIPYLIMTILLTSGDLM